MTLNRRFSSGLTFNFGYTFSKELDNLLAGTRNPFDYSLEKARGAIDRRHVVQTTVAWQLQFGAGRALNPGNAAVRALVSRWALSGLMSFASGAPLAITGSACNDDGILSTCIPNYHPAYNGNVRINGGFNVLHAVCFGAPALNPDQASFGTLMSQANQPRKLQLNARITF